MDDEITTVPCAADERILIVTLNRPNARNAMSDGLVAKMLALLQQSECSPTLRTLVLVGAGRGFCAGSDLAGIAAMQPAARAAFEAASGLLARNMRAYPLPIIAAVHGFAVGGGLTLAAAADIVVTTPDAKWSLPEVPIGLFPAWGLEAVIDRVGRPTARRLAWGIDTLNGAEAGAVGLADVVDSEPLPAALALACRLADLPRCQSSAVKQYFAPGRAAAAADQQANRLFSTACETPEAVASLKRFAAGSKPTK